MSSDNGEPCTCRFEEKMTGLWSSYSARYPRERDRFSGFYHWVFPFSGWTRTRWYRKIGPMSSPSYNTCSWTRVQTYFSPRIQYPRSKYHSWNRDYWTWEPHRCDRYRHRTKDYRTSRKTRYHTLYEKLSWDWFCSHPWPRTSKTRSPHRCSMMT